MREGTVFVRYIHGLPLATKGITTPNPDGTFSVYINADLPDYVQKEVYDHELYHIEHDHLYNFDSVKTNELSANALTEIIQHKSERPQEYEPPKNTAKQKKVAIMQKHLSSPDMAWEYNQKKLREWEEKWLFDVG